jgi:hypothetical protein
MNDVNANTIKKPETTEEALECRNTIDHLFMQGAPASDIIPLIAALRPYRGKLYAERAVLRSLSRDAYFPALSLGAMLYFLILAMQEFFEFSNGLRLTLTTVTFFVIGALYIRYMIRSTRRLQDIAEISALLGEEQEDFIRLQQRR